MDLTNIKPAEGAVKAKKRIARGEGSGKGGTSTRGHKGAQSRSGYKKMRGFEGGQMPLHRVVPKFGFTNHTRVVYQPINLTKLQRLADQEKISSIDVDTLIRKGIVGKKDLVKVLGAGELKTALKIKAHAFSKKAVEAIEKAGGNVDTVERKKKAESK